MLAVILEDILAIANGIYISIFSELKYVMNLTGALKSLHQNCY